ncbi:Clp protease N-terminal domain-containing protein [Kineococcus rhizosphaerae]|uniref:ClpA/ClpB-like protein n=1 Tax=Kineococcus rhizosphaerae TaxID=559628 RepID=A0A2T0QWP6_9ACTN|nr:Clp protease N-terminal domain-containing protein [Kineococcus rhizosphaerae]PRY09770.1 ClpA/ClpB-like protein [Kineococcus rhizosphaerae]
MFERFTKPARAAVVRAQEEARALQHHRIGAEHVLLGVLATPSVAQRVVGPVDLDTLRDLVRRHAAGERDAEALRSLGIDLDEVRRRAEESFGPGALDTGRPRRRLFGRGAPSTHVPFDRSGKKVLEDALRAALSLRHNYVGTEHILLAVLGRPEGTAATVLREAGVTLDRESATEQVLAEIRRSA